MRAGKDYIWHKKPKFQGSRLMRKHVGIIRLWGKNDNEFSQERQEAGQENVNECGLRHIWLCGKRRQKPPGTQLSAQESMAEPSRQGEPSAKRGRCKLLKTK